MIRKTFALLLILCISFGCTSFFAHANPNWDAEISVVQKTLDDTEKIVSVRISIDDITSSSGIICAIYSLQFDETCLEYVSHENFVPQNWNFGDENSLVAQDWSQLIHEEGSAPYFYYTVFNEAGTNGVTENGVLYTDINFRIINPSASETEIRVTGISLTDEDGLYKNHSLELSDIVSTLQLKREVTESESSKDAGAENESSEEESQLNGSTSSGNANETEIISTEIYLCDIKDSNGVSILEFDLFFDTTIIEFVEYEFVRPSIWVDDEDYTEDLTSTSDASNGLIHFCVLNIDETCGVKQDNTLGFKLFFRAPKGTVLDETYFTIANEYVVNALLEEVDSTNYKLNFGAPSVQNQLYSADIFFEAKESSEKAQIIQFCVTFDPKLCEFVKYELIYEDGNFDNNKIADISKIGDASEGELYFGFESVESQISIMESGLIGVRVYFEMKNGIQFDSSLLSIKDFVAKNADGVTLEDAIDIVIDGSEEKSFWDLGKVTIMVVSIVVVLASGVLVAIIYGRKKKNNVRT